MANKLTAKMRRFCECIALEDMTITEAYEAAYDADNMARRTVSREGCRLMTDDRITAYIQQLEERRQRSLIAAGLSDRERVLKKLRRLLETGEGTRAEDVQLKAARMLGESQGVFKQVTVEEKEERSPDQIMEELSQMLEELEDSRTLN